MNISDLKSGQGKIEIEGTVASLKQERSFNKFGKEGKVRNGVLRDDSGEVEISLWNEQVDQVGVGDKIKITNGWASEYQGKLQLSTGKFGKLEVISKGAGEPEPVSPSVEALVVPPKPKLQEDFVKDKKREFDYETTDDPDSIGKDEKDDGLDEEAEIEEEDFD